MTHRPSRRAAASILMNERALLLGPAPLPWNHDEASLEPLPVTVRCLPPDAARVAYLDRLRELLDAR